MLQELAYIVLVANTCFHTSSGQNAFYSNENPYSFGAPDFSDASTSSGLLNNGNIQVRTEPSAPFSKEVYQESLPSSSIGNSFQIRTEPITSFSQAQFSLFGPSSSISSNFQLAPIANPSPIEKFVSDLNSAVYSSNILSDIFDLTELSPKIFSTLLYDYVHVNAGKVDHNNPDRVASIATTPINEGIVTYTSPILLDIYSNTAAKYLFDKGALNLSNASSLARKYARFLKESADRNLKKEIPESKVLTLSDGFIDFMNSIDYFRNNTIEDMARYFANEVKRVANKS